MKNRGGRKGYRNRKADNPDVAKTDARNAKILKGRSILYTDPSFQKGEFTGIFF